MARVTCHKSAQPNWVGQGDQFFRLSGLSICRFYCGEREMGRAEIWKDEDLIFSKWRLRVTRGSEEKVIKSASPKKLWAFVENKLAKQVFRCPDEAGPRVSRRRRKFDLPY